MHIKLFILLWRRKLSVLFISSSLILFAIWIGAFLFNSGDDNSHTRSNGHILNSVDASSNGGNVHLLQKLIAQANRILRYQRQQESTRVPVPAAAHAAAGRISGGIVRFVKPTKSPPSPALISFGIVGGDDYAAALSPIVSRRKNAPSAVGESYLFEEERLKILENQQRIRNGGFDELTNNNNNIMNNMEDEHMTSVERQTQYEHELQRMGVPVLSGLGPEGPRAPKERLVHLDLKGAPPKLSFLKRILPMLKTLGATGLLIEYEDMFPYTGALEQLAAKNAYKPDELKDFLIAVAAQGISVMPLVQTFGHMEYALKLQGFEHMREIAESPQSICPSQKDSITFIELMVKQVIEFHLQAFNNFSINAATSHVSLPPTPHMTHIHIGCDEVARMGECERCRQHARNEIFLTHVTTVANFIRAHWPQLHVVIWDDMLRDMTLSEMQHSHIGNYVEPMVWVYANDIYHFIQPQLWDIYSKVFVTAWAASAFKGAFGESLMIPPLQQHLENNIRWLAVIAKEGGRFSKGFKGIALTGWQRYDHFAALCELLPIGMPSLITALSTVSKGYFSTNPKDNSILRVLDCAFEPDSRRSGHPWIELHPNSHNSQLFSICTYPGSITYKFALRLFDKLMSTKIYLTHVYEQSAWMSDYNVRHNFSSPLRVHGLTANTPELINELTTMSREAFEVMYEIFDEYTIAEFIEQTIYPVVAALRRQLEHANILLQPRVWPQRPLPYARELVDYNLIPNALLSSTSNEQQQQQQQQQQHL